MGQMSAAVERDEYRDEVRGGKYPPQFRVGVSDGGGGGMEDDVLKRLGVVESSVSEIRTQVGGITSILPHLATKADLSREIGSVRAEVGSGIAALSSEIGSVRAEIGSLKVDLTENIGLLKVDLTEKIGLLENRLVRWIIGIIIAAAGLAFTIGRYGH
jgi:hypothetical protein